MNINQFIKPIVSHGFAEQARIQDMLPHIGHYLGSKIMHFIAVRQVFPVTRNVDITCIRLSHTSCL
jgi:hypothetical protein